MTAVEPKAILEAYMTFINNKGFPCVAAKAALARHQVKCMVAGHMACPKDDQAILKFLYDFVEDYRPSDNFFHSAAILFNGPEMKHEEMFDGLLWQRLQALADLDSENFEYDQRVSPDPSSSYFSFSLHEEAFFIIGLHPSSSRPTRQFKFPALVFNPHAQFEKLRETNRYEPMKEIVRKRDIAYSGSVNPMLKDFGESSEVYQYSGKIYDQTWQCPLKIHHAKNKHNSST